MTKTHLIQSWHGNLYLFILENKNSIYWNVPRIEFSDSWIVLEQNTCCIRTFICQTGMMYWNETNLSNASTIYQFDADAVMVGHRIIKIDINCKILK